MREDLASTWQRVCCAGASLWHALPYRERWLFGQQSLSYAGAIQNFRQSLVEEPQPDDQRKLTRAEALSAVKFLQET